MELIIASEALGALAQPTRLAAFRLLMAAGPQGMAAGAIATALAVPHNTLSTHLAILEHARLVTVTRAGRSLIYATDMEGARDLIGYLIADCCGGRPELCAPIAAMAAACCVSDAAARPIVKLTEPT